MAASRKKTAITPSVVALNQAVDDGAYGYVTWTWWPAKADVFVYQGLEKVLTG